jgi:uracil-DNA glycosylase
LEAFIQNGGKNQVKRWDLAYWATGECQVVEERIADDLKMGFTVNPVGAQRYRSMAVVPFAEVRVAIFGQDPYPSPEHATGIAFSVPEGCKVLPQTLTNIYAEYSNDLHLNPPKTGCLEKWWKQGVFLWNVIPTCRAHKSLSHDWEEWHPLTQEIVKKLSDKGVVLVFLGGKARQFAQFADPKECEILEFSHPSPRASRASNKPFFGSRMFTTINASCVKLGLEPIDWRL